MSKHWLGKCPHCQHSLSVALSRYFWSQMPGNDFEFECPNCQKVLTIEVEPQPIFWVSKVAAQQGVEPTVGTLGGSILTLTDDDLEAISKL